MQARGRDKELRISDVKLHAESVAITGNKLDLIKCYCDRSMFTVYFNEQLNNIRQ